MDRGKKERIKTCILAVLVLTSVLQAGILLSYQSQRFPINFLQAFLGTTPISQSDMDDMAREEYFVPYRIVVYGGEGNLRWVLGAGNEYFKPLWDEAEYYMREALKSAEITQVDRNLWNTLIHKRSVIFEMKNEVPLSLVEWFLDFSTDTKSGIPGVYKMMIAPDDSFYREMNTVYILSGRGLYKAEISYPPSGMNSRSEYHAFMERLKNSEGVETYMVFGATGYPHDIPADLLSSFSGFKRLRHINYNIPEKIGDIEHLTGVLLDEYRESFDRSVIDNGTYVFQTLSKMFRVYAEDGVLEYRYTGRINRNTGKDVGRIFSLVYRFITPKKQGLIPDARLYLHSVKTLNSTTYRFEFGYKIGDYPVYIKSGNDLLNGLVVDATEEQILYCKWILREISFDRVSANYNNNFLALLAGMNSLHGLSPNALLSSDEGYVLEPDDRSSLEPVWIIGNRDGSLYYVPMSREGA